MSDKLEKRRADVILSSAGKRVELLKIFEDELRDRRPDARVAAMDIEPLAAAMLYSQSTLIPPRCESQEFIQEVKRYCEHFNTFLLVPLIDSELLTFSEHRGEFDKIGTLVNISGLRTIELCRDKLTFSKFLETAQLPFVPSLTDDEVAGKLSRGDTVFVKPRYGSSSIGTQVLGPSSAVTGLSFGNTDLIFQPFLRGVEYSADVFVDRTVRSVVLRQQHEMRGGETSIARTIRNTYLEGLVRDVVNALPDPFGILSVDLIVDFQTRSPHILEINPRFPGGYPLSHHSGSPMVGWLLDLSLGESPDYEKPLEMKDLWVARYLTGEYCLDPDPSIGGAGN